MSLLIAILVSSCICAAGYYWYRRHQIQKEIRRIQDQISPFLQERLETLQSEVLMTNEERDQLETEVKTEVSKQTNFTENPFVRAQKKRHKHFRDSQVPTTNLGKGDDDEPV